jgi:hypothetical protein
VSLKKVTNSKQKEGTIKTPWREYKWGRIAAGPNFDPTESVENLVDSRSTHQPPAGLDFKTNHAFCAIEDVAKSGE